MLKSAVDCVLASFRSSTYPRGYASGLHSLRPCRTTLLNILRLRDCATNRRWEGVHTREARKPLTRCGLLARVQREWRKKSHHFGWLVEVGAYEQRCVPL